MIYGYEDSEVIVCADCGEGQEGMKEADPVGYPDGYTCADCGDTFDKTGIKVGE